MCVCVWVSVCSIKKGKCNHFSHCIRTTITCTCTLTYYIFISKQICNFVLSKAFFYALLCHIQFSLVEILFSRVLVQCFSLLLCSGTLVRVLYHCLNRNCNKSFILLWEFVAWLYCCNWIFFCVYGIFLWWSDTIYQWLRYDCLFSFIFI